MSERPIVLLALAVIYVMIRPEKKRQEALLRREKIGTGLLDDRSVLAPVPLRVSPKEKAENSGSRAPYQKKR